MQAKQLPCQDLETD